MASQDLSYTKLKTSSEARAAEEARAEKLKRDVLVLVLDHLRTGGYVQTAERLELEAGMSLGKYEVCDNMDLSTIVLEYESYYTIKFQHPPKLTKKHKHDDDDPKHKSSARNSAPGPRGTRPVLPKIGASVSQPPDAPPSYADVAQQPLAPQPPARPKKKPEETQAAAAVSDKQHLARPSTASSSEQKAAFGLSGTGISSKPVVEFGFSPCAIRYAYLCTAREEESPCEDQLA